MSVENLGQYLSTIEDPRCSGPVRSAHRGPGLTSYALFTVQHRQVAAGDEGVRSRGYA